MKFHWQLLDECAWIILLIQMLTNCDSIISKPPFQQKITQRRTFRSLVWNSNLSRTYPWDLLTYLLKCLWFTKMVPLIFSYKINKHDHILTDQQLSVFINIIYEKYRLKLIEDLKNQIHYLKVLEVNILNTYIYNQLFILYWCNCLNEYSYRQHRLLFDK